MIYGYARVSTDAQDLTNQRITLKVEGCEKIFSDKLTGTHADRPQLQRLLRKVTQGDVVKVGRTAERNRNTPQGYYVNQNAILDTPRPSEASQHR